MMFPGAVPERAVGRDTVGRLDVWRSVTVADPSAPQTDRRPFLRILAARRRSFLLPALVGIGLLLAAGPAAGQEPPRAGSDAPARYRAVLDRYCVTCHNGRLRTADLELDAADITNVSGRPDLWEKVVRKLRGRDMPPRPRPRPAEAVYDGFAGGSRPPSTRRRRPTRGPAVRRSTG